MTKDGKVLVVKILTVLVFLIVMVKEHVMEVENHHDVLIALIIQWVQLVSYLVFLVKRIRPTVLFVNVIHVTRVWLVILNAHLVGNV